MSSQRVFNFTSVVVLVAGLSAGLLSACRSSSTVVSTQPEGTLARILKEGTLRVGYINYPPSTFLDKSTGTVRGHFVDTLKEILRQLDPRIQIVFEETSFADFSAALNTRRIDLSIAGTFSTIPRSKVVAFTRPLAYLGRGAIVRKGDSRFSPETAPIQFDNSAIKVGVVEGEGSHEFVVANFKNQRNVTVFSGTDLSQCLAAVSSGQVDVGLSDALETAKYAKAHPEVIDLYAEHPYDLTPIAWSVRQDDYAWKAFLDTAIETLEIQGKVAQFEHGYDYRWVQPVTVFRPR